MKQPSLSLTARLLFGQAVGFMIAISIGLVILYFGIRAQVYDGIRTSGLTAVEMLVHLLKEEAHLLQEAPVLIQPDASLKSKGLNRSIADFTASFPDISRMSVVDYRLRVLADSSGAPLGSITDQSALIELMRSGDKHETRSLAYTSSGQRYLRLSQAIHGSYDPVRASDVVGAVSIDLSLSAAERDIDAIFIWVAGVLLFLSLLQIGSQYLLLRKLALIPLRTLMRTVQQLEGGRLEARAPSDNPGEPGDLGRAFNRMADEIERTNQALREHSLRFQTIISSSPLAMIQLDSAKRVEMWNPAAERIFGWTEAEVLAHPLPTIPPDKRDELSTILAALERGESLTNVITQRLRRDGTRVHVSASMSPLRELTGTITGFSAIIADISQLKQVEDAMATTNETLSRSVATLEQRTGELTLLGEMGNLLQACIKPQEAHRVIAHAVAKIFPGMAGTLYEMPPSRDHMEPVIRWGAGDTKAQVFAMDGCWALRRGCAHRVEDVATGLICEHVTAEGGQQWPSLCVPMMAQGEALGLLHVQCTAGSPALTQEHQRLAETIAEQLAMALSNLNLREALRQQSIRDTLTGLFNRRYMDETLAREIERARRRDLPIGVIMLDIDFFKRFNDTYGHQAGDVLLTALGQFLRTQVRLDDIACRYGGEEFTLILPGASQELAHQRAEQLRVNIHALQVSFEGDTLAAITLSLGVAVFPAHGETAQAVLRAADAALYQAKENGRDRVELAVGAPAAHHGAALSMGK
ncbi:diguanylate cyclase [uncultured Thiodictyon sp.]|jgi:diguanylate cyclase (GGDEF)-like protein/PAS domain S-box-containing protein|uniref:diguanylate cyclase n=1 Tax=uncultured Thiodictyon sp. TaxID=1846217 RepID=UPI0025ED77EA|nr:diguanylate cyclase [uncultured Thiodictyon sp.]